MKISGQMTFDSVFTRPATHEQLYYIGDTVRGTDYSEGTVTDTYKEDGQRRYVVRYKVEGKIYSRVERQQDIKRLDLTKRKRR